MMWEFGLDDVAFSRIFFFEFVFIYGEKRNGTENEESIEEFQMEYKK